MGTHLRVLSESYLMKTNMTEKNFKKLLKPWHMGTHLRILSVCYPINTNMPGSRWFSKSFVSLCFGPK